MVIEIRLHEDLPTRNQNKLRYRIEMGIWLAKMRKAKEEKDYDEMDRLDQQYNLIGLP